MEFEPRTNASQSIYLSPRPTRFMHWLDDKTEYKVSFRGGSGSAFTAAATVMSPTGGAAMGVEASLEVSFEPTMIGDNIRDALVLTSATGGEFTCPLLGRCIPPKPQGPIDVSKGSGSVPFQNVFTAEAEFTFSVDNPSFVVKTGEKLAGKKATSIAISFKLTDPSKPRTGKLTVSCPSQTSSQWVYYLQA